MKAITCYICGKKKIPKAQVPSKNELFLKLESTQEEKKSQKQLKTTLSWVNILNEKCDSIARTEMELRENLCEVQKEKEKFEESTNHNPLTFDKGKKKEEEQMKRDSLKNLSQKSNPHLMESVFSKFYRFLNLFEIKTQDGFCKIIAMKLKSN
ncbi:hypothetical protein M0811_11733 [Anaeramoeba ignava]|uniref:Uncharacterized protein n=1 Tax=Anaeramoeba ignava TaxID=1746090 RepID=A0A9Q0LCX8_ANAIG|nr:hypothetical protein M0811_11733 [Anaeramoeba ignava]